MMTMIMTIFQHLLLSSLHLIHQFWPHVQNRYVQCVSSNFCGHVIYADSTAFAWRIASHSAHTDSPLHVPHSYAYAAVTFFEKKYHLLGIFRMQVYVHECERHVCVAGHGSEKSIGSHGTQGKGILTSFFHPYPHGLRPNDGSSAPYACSPSHSLHTWRVSK